MILSELLLLRRLGLGMLSFTGALIVLVGGWILISAFTSTPEIEVTAEATDAASREPASLLGVAWGGVVNTPETKVESKFETFALGCVKDGVKVSFKSAAKQVRLVGRVCHDQEARVNESRIINYANGFEATVFNLKSGKFTSDYISLSEGSNELMIKIASGANKQLTTSVTIVKQ